MRYEVGSAGRPVFDLQASEPAAVALPLLGPPEPGTLRERHDVGGADASPAEPVAAAVGELQARLHTGRGHARRVKLDQHLTVGGEQLRNATQQRVRVTADADVAIEQQSGVPTPGAGQIFEYRRLDRARALLTGGAADG